MKISDLQNCPCYSLFSYDCDMNNVALKIPVSIPLVDSCNGLLLASLSFHQMRQLKQPLLELTVNAQNEDSYPLAQMFHFYLSKEGFVVIEVIVRVWLAYVASVSDRVIARTLERKQKKKNWKGKGEGDGRRGNVCQQPPRFWKTPLDISRFGSFVN